MKERKLNKNEIATSDLWIIGSFSLIGLCAGLFMPQKTVMGFTACVMVGAGFGLVISTIIAKYNT